MGFHKNHVLLYHLLFGGKLLELAQQLEMSTSTIHRILDKAKKDGLYDWKINKEGMFDDESNNFLETHGDKVVEYILSFKDEDSPKNIKSEIQTYKKIVALPDIHYPEHINLLSIEKFLADYQPDILIYLGDVMDLSYLSKFEKENKLNVGNKLREEYNEVMKVMDKQIKLSKAKEVYFIEGNHEYRVQKFLETYPAGTGFIEIPVAMKLEERGINWVGLNEFVQIKDLFFTHGTYYNMYHARKHVDTYQRNVIYGHTHAWQVHSGYHPYDKKLPYVAKSIGCLCNLNPTYMKHRPNQWINSFYICEMEENGRFSDNVIPIVNENFRIPGSINGGTHY
jgi:predicted phosphodiesterase